MLATGDRIAGEWLVERKLGSGGLGAVFLCSGTDGTTAAVKIVLPQSPKMTARLRTRLEREAKVLMGLEHEGIVRVSAWGEDPGRDLFYLVMDAVDGTELSSQMVRRPDGTLDEHRLHAFVASLCDALAFAHASGVAHRDLKPPNVLVRRADGRPVLVDWGSIFHETDDRLTTYKDSHALGLTERYAPPEALFSPAGTDPFQWDVYSLGVMIHELICGDDSLYPTADSRHELAAVKTAEALDPGPQAPPALREIVRRCTAPMPNTRLRTIRSVQALLLQWEPGVHSVPHQTYMFGEEGTTQQTAIPSDTSLRDGISNPTQARTTDPRRHGPTAVPASRVTSAPRIDNHTVPAEAFQSGGTAAVRAPVVVDDPPEVRPRSLAVPVTAAVTVLGTLAVLALGAGLWMIVSERAPTGPAPTPSEATAEVREAPATVAPTEAVPVEAPPEAPPPVQAPPVTRTAPAAERASRAPAVAASETRPAAPPAQAPAPAPAIVAAPKAADPLAELAELVATKDLNLAGALAADPKKAAQAVRDIARVWPEESQQATAARARRRLVADMNAKPADGNALIEALAQEGQLVRFLASSQFGQAADFKVGLRLRMAERIPASVRQPASTADCKSLAEVVDVLGRPPVTDAHPWIAEACGACEQLTGSPVGKCGEI